MITTSNFAEAHRSVIQYLLAEGLEISTDYDKPDELPSLDSPMSIAVTDPWNPPIFSRCVWDSPLGMLAYRDEVLDGVHDHLIGSLSYTYHSRFEDQIEGVMEELRRNPYSRRAQFITWQPDTDLGAPYPPCFQRGWFRVRDNRLDFHTHWRSRDALKAWGSNVFAFAHLHKRWAEELGHPIGVYREFVDSMHIYGRDIEQARSLAQRPLEKWSWSLSEIERLAAREMSA